MNGEVDSPAIYPPYINLISEFQVSIPDTFSLFKFLLAAVTI